jgi:hypothetical protein
MRSTEQSWVSVDRQDRRSDLHDCSTFCTSKRARFRLDSQGPAFFLGGREIFVERRNRKKYLLAPLNSELLQVVNTAQTVNRNLDRVACER